MSARPLTRDDRLYACVAKLDEIYGRERPAPPPSCDMCARFNPDSINPPGGMGDCGAGKGYRFPGQRVSCTDRKPK